MCQAGMGADEQQVRQVTWKQQEQQQQSSKKAYQHVSLPSVCAPTGGGVTHLQSLYGLLNVPPLLHMNKKLCGGAHLDVHVLRFAAHKSLPSFSMMRPAKAVCADRASAAITTAQQAHLCLAMLSHRPANDINSCSRTQTHFAGQTADARCLLPVFLLLMLLQLVGAVTKLWPML